MIYQEIESLSGIALIYRIDEVLKENGMSRKALCEELGILQGTMATWKTKNIFPPAKTLSNIADKLEVSLDWLIAGYPGYGVEKEVFGEYSRESIRERIYESLSKNKKLTEEDMQRLHEKHRLIFPLSYKALRNWANGRISLDLFYLQKMSYVLEINLQFLLTGVSGKVPKDFDPGLYKAARKNQNYVFGFEKISDDKKKVVTDVLEKMIELEILENT